MNWKIWGPLSAAVVLGSGAAYTGYLLLAQRPQPVVVQQTKMADLVVAAHSLPAGTRLTADDLVVMRIAADSLPPDAVAQPAKLVGRVVKMPLVSHQPLLPELLSPEGAAPGLAAVLPEGFRAVTIEVDTYHGLEGFLKPEARVDIVATLRGTGEPAVRAIAQNLRVLAVNGRLEGEQKPAGDEEEAKTAKQRSVTLMVTPEQAGAIQLASTQGMPRLVLRAGGDEQISPFKGLTLAQLRGDAQPVDAFAGADPVPPPSVVDVPVEPVSPTTSVQDQEPGGTAQTPQAPPAPLRHVVEVIRGGIVTRESVPAGSASPPGAGPTTRRAEQAIVGTDHAPADE